MVQLEILCGKSANQIILVRRFPFVLGRKENSDLQSSDDGVWDQHFQIEYHTGAEFYLVSNDTVTTLINGERAVSPVPLTNGSEITAGALKIRFNLADSQIRSYWYREIGTWLAVGGILALQFWLLMALPK